MSYKITATAEFRRHLKALAKRYSSIKSDLVNLAQSLEKDPLQGVELSPGIRKIRMAIASKGRGKSGGARVITYNVITTEQDGKIYLIDIYDKSEYSTVDIAVIHNVVKSLSLDDK